MILFRPVGRAELALIRAADDRAFPPRLPEQPIFYPVLSFEYAEEIARDWNSVDRHGGLVGFVTQFEVEDAYASRYDIRTVGAKRHQELWVPAADLAEFNRRILGKIEIIAEYRNGRKVAAN